MAKWYGKAATVVLYCTFLALILFNLPSGAKIFLICVALCIQLYVAYKLCTCVHETSKTA